MEKRYTHLGLIYALICFLNMSTVSAQWLPSGPQGGNVMCMARAANTWYAVAGFYFSNSTLYSSSDNGNTWAKVASATLPVDVRAIAIIGNSIFLGTGSGIFRSDDNGLTWNTKNNGFPLGESWINHLAISGSTLFAAGTSSGMLRSTDNGEHWAVINSGLDDTYAYSLTASENAVFVGTGDQSLGVFRSTDNGDTWQQVNNGMPFYSPTIYSLCFSGTDLYAGTGESGGIWKSADNGDNWILTNIQTTYYTTYTAIAGDGSVVIAGARDGGGLIRSTDNGESWSDANNGIDNYGQVTSILINGGTTLVSTKGGIYKSADLGNSWATASNGLNAHIATFPAFASIGTDIFTGTTGGGVFRSSDEGTNWTSVNNGLPVNQWLMSSLYSTSSALFTWDRVSTDGGNSWEMRNSLSPGSSTYGIDGPGWVEHGTGYFAIKSYDNAGIYRSYDNGANWTPINNGIPIPDSSLYFSIYSNGTTLFVGTSIGAYFSTDNGDSWNVSVFPNFNFWALSASSFTSTPTASIYGLGGGGGMRGIYRTTDNGATWVQVHDMLVTKFEQSGNNIYACGTNLGLVNGTQTEIPSVFLSQDDGLNWTKITENIINFQTSTFTAEGTNIYISKTAPPDYGVFRSSDNGINWINISDGLPKTFASSFYIHNGKIFAATNGNSVWKRNLTDFVAPAQPGSIEGLVNPCIGSIQTYSVKAEPGVTYDWQFPDEWIISAGNGTNTVSVTVGISPALIYVVPSNAFGSGPAQFQLIFANSTPPPAVISQNGGVISSNAQSGNQWYRNDTLIAGATAATYEIAANGTYYSIVTINGCSSVPSNSLNILSLGIDDPAETMFKVYPVPSNGLCYIQTELTQSEKFDIQVVNSMGIQVFELKNVVANGSDVIKIDVRHVPSGMYVMQIITGKYKLMRKMMINHEN